MEQLKQDLLATRALIAQGWTQGTSARDTLDRATDVRQPSACKFCLVGAATKATGSALVATPESVARYHRLAATLRRYMPTSFYGLVEFNDYDDRTVEEVLQLIDTALKELGHDETAPA